jgi:gamma-glutamylcyclotransferase (GGCT)/AIG2-like uncharacterized protein YtfP
MHVFVYGTLTDPETAGRVLDAFEYRGDAALHGCHRVDGRYPTLAPDGRTEGRLLSTPDSAALDRYEGVDRGLYVRCSVPAEGVAPDTVDCYVGDPDLLDAPADWPGDGPFAQRLRRYVRENDVRVTLA